MPRRVPAYALANAVRDALPSLPPDAAIKLHLALDDFARATPAYASHRQRLDAGQQRIGWTIRDMAERAGVDLFAADRIVRRLVAQGRVVRVSRGRFLDAEKAPPIHVPKRRTVRMGHHIEALESA